MRKSNKGRLLLLAALIVVMLSMTVLQVGASRNGATIGDNSEVIAIGEIGVVGTTITYIHCENISPEIATQLVNSMLGTGVDATEMIQPMSFWCIFSHDWTYGMTIITIHNAYSTNPRCRETRISLRMCTRCSTSLMLSEWSGRRGCC